MATENIPVFNKYEGNGTATEFSIGFPYLDTSFVKVYIKRTGKDEEQLDSNRFSFVNDTTIKFPILETDEVLQEGEVITIQRETSLGSEYEFDNQVRLFPEEVMNADDLAFQQIQELARDLERAVKVKPTDEQTSDELIDEVYYTLKTATETTEKAIEAAETAASMIEGIKETIEVESSAAIDRIDEASEHNIEKSRVWAEGEQSEVMELGGDFSSRGFADFAMAIANTPEDVPLEESKLLAMEIIKGPKGDSSVGEFTGDNTIEGTLNISNNEMYPLKIVSEVNQESNGFQLMDSNGRGNSRFEHCITEDGYITKLTNHNNSMDSSVSMNLCQYNNGSSVLDLTDIDTVLTPTPSETDNTQRPATTEWVNNAMTDVSKISADETITGQKTFETTNEKTLNLVAKDVDTSYIPLTDVTQAIVSIKDVLGNIMGYIFAHNLSNGEQRVGLQARRVVDGVEKYASINCGVNGNGEVYTSAVNPDGTSDSSSIATTSWVNNKLFLDVTKRTSLSVSLDKAFTIPNNGFLALGIEVGSQTDSKVNVLLSNSGEATSSSYIVCAVAHNGGAAERSTIPVIFPVKKNQSVYLGWNSAGNASVKTAYLFRNS